MKKKISFLIEFLFVVLILLITNYKGFSQNQINWKPYFTLQPIEGLNFQIDSSSVVFNASVPGINIANDGKIILGWSAPSPNRKAGISYDSGRTFYQLFGLQQPMQPDGGFIYLPDGRTRFLTEEPAPDRTPQRHKSRIISYISNDGYNWTKENGIRYQPSEADDSISSVCEVIQIQDSIWRMYYVGDWYRTNGTRTAISTDWGVNWRAESINNILRVGDVDPHPVYLTNGKIRLYLRTGMGKPLSQSGIGYCESDDGLNFDTNNVKLLFADSAFPPTLKLDPMVIRYPNGKVACYFGALPFLGQPGIQKIIADWSEPSTKLNGEMINQSKEIILYQNYPNPFNSVSKIKYKLANSSNVKLVVFDLLGREVCSLVNEFKTQGEYEAEVNISNLDFEVSSGIYFYQLKVGSITRNKKMILLR